MSRGTIDYKQTSRKKLVFLIALDDNENEYILFDKSRILVSCKQEECIEYHDIQEVHLSLCSRLYNPGVISSSPVDIAVKRLKRGGPFVIGPANMIYSMDMDIVTSDGVKQFESYTLHRCLEIIHILKEHQVKVHDPLLIEDILSTYIDDIKRQKYLDQNFAKMAKENQLDNPRGTFMMA